MIRPSWFAVVSAVVGLAALQPAAYAQATEDKTAEEAGSKPSAPETEAPAEAVEHFQRGVDYYSEGDYAAALIEFQLAYAVHPTFKLLYNLGQVANELRDYASAERYYRNYLREGGTELSPERRAEISAELERLRLRVATLHLRSNQKGVDFSVDDRVVAHKNARVRVSAGQRRISAEKSGLAPLRRVIDVAGGEELDVRLDFEQTATAATPPGAASDSSPWPWVTGIGTGVVGLAAAIVGVSAIVDTSAREEQLRRYTSSAELDRLSSRVHTQALVADVLLGVAVAGAVTTFVLLLSEEQSEPRHSSKDAPDEWARQPRQTAF